MVTAVVGVVNDPKYQPAWQGHEAFAETVSSVSDALAAVDEQTEIAQGNPGARNAKEQARKHLCRWACEIIGGVGAYASKNAEHELLGKLDYTESNVTAGKVNEVVARCKSIHAAATEHLDSLGKYRITAAKLTAFKKAIEAFDKVKTAPRQGRVSKSAATLLLPQLVKSAVAIVREQLDGLMVPFQETHPNFYAEYFAARRVVNQRGARGEKAAESGTASTNPVASKAA